MQDPRQVSAAEDDGDPVERRRPEREAGEQEIDVGQRGQRVHQPLTRTSSGGCRRHEQGMGSPAYGSPSNGGTGTGYRLTVPASVGPF